MSNVFLDLNEQFTVASSSRIFGASANESLIIQENVSDIQLDQNIEKVGLPLKSADYHYQQTGNTLNIFSGNTLILEMPLQSTGSQVVFADGSVIATLASTVMSLGGTTVSSNSATALTPINIDTSIHSANTAQFSLTTATTTINEGQTQTYTLTSSIASSKELSFSYLLLPSGSNPASADDFSSATSGSLVMAANSTSGTLSIDIKQDAIDEFAEGFSLVLKDNDGKEIASLENIINNIKSTDTVAPVISVASSTVNYTENQQSGALLTTVLANDNIAVDKFSIVSGNTENFFSINAQGQIQLSSLGLQAASNDFESVPNSFLLGVSATDAANNVSNVTTINFIIDDDSRDNISSNTAIFTLSRNYNLPTLAEGLIGIQFVEDNLDIA